MLKVDILAISRIKKGAHLDIINDYKKRIKWNLNIYEMESKYTEATKCQEEEAEKILAKIKESAIVVVLDERGDGLRSLDFAKTIQNFTNNGESHLQFIIGGADGLTQPVKDRADILLSFGQQTWPHVLARIMLLEQIYRAQQILAGHPYHRE